MLPIIVPLTQDGRPRCSLPLNDADLSLGNANWQKGLQAMSDWCWSGHLNSVPFPNHLARFFLHIPGIFEQQLNYSTTLIFDEPSFRNGIQISGFLDRVTRELAISLMAQTRRCWYTMTHHAVLGHLTARKHGLSDADFVAKWTNLPRFRDTRGIYTEVELEVLEFAEAFATNPKAYLEEQFNRLKETLARDNRQRELHENDTSYRAQAARLAWAAALATGASRNDADQAAARAASEPPSRISEGALEMKRNAQVVELTFLCLQFVALTGVFTSLNIPDEAFLAAVMQDTLPPAVIRHINALCLQSGSEMKNLVPARVEPPVKAIESGVVVVSPSAPRGRRIPLEPYETKLNRDLDKGVTVGGVQVGTYGWSFGAHFPGSLVYCLMLHPELARYEPPYSLPLLFNEDEWRNGVHTAGFVSRLLKEIVYQKIYKTTRSRYGLEHHTMFLFNSFFDLYGVGRSLVPGLTYAQRHAARERAITHAEQVVLHVHNFKDAPDGVFTNTEIAVLAWVEAFMVKPHDAFQLEAEMRAGLDADNRREVAAGTRVLDKSPGIGESAAFERLLNHQVAELAMLTGHMDGLGRALTILQLHSEERVQIVEGEVDPATLGIRPSLSDQGEVKPTGYFNTRLALLDFMRDVVGVTSKVFTMNELMANPLLNSEVRSRLSVGDRNIQVSGDVAQRTAEF